MTFDLSAEALDFDCNKKCSRCGAIKPWDEFGVQKNGKNAGRLYSRCRPCAKAASIENPTGPFASLLKTVKFRAKSSGLAYDLSDHRDQLRHRFDIGLCELTGIPFDLTKGGGKGSIRWNTPSIDRIDAKGGYVYSNVRIILWSLNAAFNYWGEEQFEQVARAWLERKTK